MDETLRMERERAAAPYQGLRFVELLELDQERVTIDRETIPGTVFVRVVLERAFAPGEAEALLGALEEEQLRLPVTHRLRLEVLTDRTWCEIIPFGDDDRRPAILTAGDGGWAVVAFQGDQYVARGETLGAALKALRACVGEAEQPSAEA